MTTINELGLTLQKMQDQLDRIEKFVSNSASMPKTSKEAILREKLHKLTIKRHAVLTATLGGVGYAELAKIMGCDLTTVKLHMKGALNLFEIANRSILLSSHKDLIDSIPDKDYEKNYGIGKRWWLEQKPDLMDVLRKTKPAANQHTEDR
jgi:hypothetical protein